MVRYTIRRIDKTSPVAEIQSMCIGLPQLFAGLDVEEGQDKENYGEKQHDGVLHANVSPAGRFRACSILRTDELRSLGVRCADTCVENSSADANPSRLNG